MVLVALTRNTSWVCVSCAKCLSASVPSVRPCAGVSRVIMLDWVAFI